MRFNWRKAKDLVDNSRLRRKAIAADCAVTEGTFKMILTGHTNPGKAVVRLLAQSLKVPEEELYEKDNAGDLPPAA